MEIEKKKDKELEGWIKEDASLRKFFDTIVVIMIISFIFLLVFIWMDEVNKKKENMGVELIKDKYEDIKILLGYTIILTTYCADKLNITLEELNEEFLKKEK